MTKIIACQRRGDHKLSRATYIFCVVQEACLDVDFVRENETLREFFFVAKADHQLMP